MATGERFKRLAGSVLAITIWVLAISAADGQGPPGGESRRDGPQWGGGPPMGPPPGELGPMGPPRWDRGPGGSRRGGRGFSPEAREEMARRMAERLKGMDANQNGLLEAEELGDDRSRGMVEFMIRRGGMEPKYPIEIKKLQEGLQRGSGPDGNGDSRSGESGGGDEGSKSGSAKEPLVPGFGVKAQRPAVPGFGKPDDAKKPVAAQPASPSGAANASNSSSGGSGGGTDYRSYAQSLLNQYDENKNGVLEEKEWHGMKRDHWAADRDGNKVITLDELSSHLVSYSKQGSGGSSGSSSDRRSSRSGRPGDGKGYRFRTPTERLPSGLPDEFTRRDADGDGQVSMAEYASYWSDSKATEFIRLDLDNDGLITAAECISGNWRD
ncbi:MAG: hypothetical protein A2V70_09585 [Planctomycetes bacterium RBG_13_63_9]|nr:MAG: hypothetical protein A2V70_09585 [Planctomycetes bacterium RBG_13_63_9]